MQLCERALTSLKYFNESAPDYHIIVAGSLLGVAVNREKFSFPVGKVDMKTLYPMDMEEFMIAMGEGDLVKQIKGALQQINRCRRHSTMRLCSFTGSILWQVGCRSV